MQNLFLILERLASDSPAFFKYLRYVALFAFAFCGASLLLTHYEFIAVFSEKQIELLHLIGSNATTIFLTTFLTKKNDK